MFPLFILGLALLAGLLLAGRWFTTADPKTLIKVLKGLLFGVIGAVALFFVFTGRLAWAFFALPALLPWFMRARQAHRMYKTFSRMASGGPGRHGQETRRRGAEDRPPGQGRLNAGQTHIERVLAHAITETRERKIDALVFVGDCFEEDIDQVGKTAGELGLMGVPAFMFHEGADPIAAFAFQQIAKLTNGAYCQFDANSAQVLKDLLSAVAVYAAGGSPALEDMARKRGGGVLKIAHQVKGG